MKNHKPTLTRQGLIEVIGLLRYSRKKATGGMWAQGELNHASVYRANSRHHGRHVADAIREQDALFIVEAHNFLPEVLDALEAARVECADLAGQLRDVIAERDEARASASQEYRWRVEQWHRGHTYRARALAVAQRARIWRSEYGYLHRATEQGYKRLNGFADQARAERDAAKRENARLRALLAETV